MALCSAIFRTSPRCYSPSSPPLRMHRRRFCYQKMQKKPLKLSMCTVNLLMVCEHFHLIKSATIRQWIVMKEAVLSSMLLSSTG
jgi:hypothetical protein